MKLYLSELLVKDPYNKYCVDCTKNESTHANISHGTFVCLNCANILMNEFGMDKCYIKGIFNDLWDTYQLHAVTQGGNKKFWDFMKDYNLEAKEIVPKYLSSESLYYKRRLAAIIQDRNFEEKAPAKNVDELMDKGLDFSKKAVAKGGEVVNKISNWFNK